MINEHQKKEILKKILNCSEFKESKRYQQLLQYLVAAMENQEYVKETTIAADLFSKDSKFDPHDDPTVRVYISNLRKKLDHYYFTEGKDDPIRIEIPKGRYHIEFVRTSDAHKKPVINYQLLVYFFFIPIMIALISFIIIQKRQITPKNSLTSTDEIFPIWKEFLQKNETPTLVVLGDYFFLYEREKSVEGGYFVRDPAINSPEELKQILKKEPRLIERFVECNFTYLGPSSAVSMTYILPILLQGPSKIFLKLSSELKWEDLNKYNMIFVGTFKTLYQLNKLMPRFPFKYQIIPPQLFLLDEKADTVKTFHSMRTERASYKKDFGLIIKHLGPKKNIIMLFVGFDELGVIESVRMSVDQSFMSQIKKMYLQDTIQYPFYFFSVIGVEGVDRIAFNSQVEHFQLLDFLNFK